jgi:Immunoglobulin domain
MQKNPAARKEYLLALDDRFGQYGTALNGDCGDRRSMRPELADGPPQPTTAKSMRHPTNFKQRNEACPLWLLFCLMLAFAITTQAQEEINSHVVEMDSVNAGPLVVIGFTNPPSPPPTNTIQTNAIVIMTNDVAITNPGTININVTASYLVLTPTTNATLELIASSTGSNGIDMLVYSSQNIFTFIGGDSCHTTNATNTVMVKFDAVSNVIYDVEVVGEGAVSMKFGLGVAPALTTVQSNTAVAQGCSVTLNGAATAIPPPAFQWQFNDVDIGGATNSTLTLNNASATMIGNYRLKTTNDFGVAFSPEAGLNVVPVQISAPTAVVSNNFHFSGTGLARQSYIIESSSDFKTWQSAFVVGAAFDGTFSFTQTIDTNAVAKFFRARPDCN